jgi:hypothetical protein
MVNFQHRFVREIVGRTRYFSRIVCVPIGAPLAWTARAQFFRIDMRDARDLTSPIGQSEFLRQIRLFWTSPMAP